MINAEVKVKQGEGELDRALKRLKAKLDNEGTLDEVRRRRRFMTPKRLKEFKLKVQIKKNKQNALKRPPTTKY